MKLFLELSFNDEINISCFGNTCGMSLICQKAAGSSDPGTSQCTRQAMAYVI